ncbi:MAG: hypothetical protein OQK99_03940 [Gammaproteobacteria bacterium]|jgi:hypothetical protein|nr:hypothetical protein [Gammaproteobacteria bacterium]
MDPVVRLPRAIATGSPVLVDCLLAADEDTGAIPLTDRLVCFTRLLTPQQTCELALPAGLEIPGEAATGLMLGPTVRWPVLRMDHRAFGHLVRPGHRDGPETSAWVAVLEYAARSRLGLAMDAPGEGLCPVFAPRRWQGATGATLLATPSDCATVCLDIQVCACLDKAERLDWRCFRQAMIDAVEVGNAVLDDLPLAGEALGNQSHGLRRLALHLSDLGELAMRMGMQPGLQSTLARLLQVINVASDAAMGESLRLGRLHGPFPALLEAEWVKRTLQPSFRWRIQALMDRFWLRNSQLLVLSPCSIMSPAVTAGQLLAWANLIPLLASVEGFSARLPPAWRDLPHSVSARLLGRIWALGHGRHQVRAY